MFYLIVGVFFVLSCLTAWLLLFASGREWVVDGICVSGRWLANKLIVLENQVSSTTVLAGRSVRLAAKETGKTIQKQSWVLLTATFIVFIPPLVALLLSSKSRLDGFDSTPHETNFQITQLLTGEQLVPPAPLPPAIFTTEEVSIIRPMLDSASRNWAKLNPDFEQHLLQVFKIMKQDYGYNMAIIEGYRSPERQNMLAKLGTHVTNAKAFQSYHQFGLAADCAFLRDGKLVISEKDPWAMRGYQLYGEVAESLGLRWGGRWKMMDFGHVELHRSHVLKI